MVIKKISFNRIIFFLFFIFGFCFTLHPQNQDGDSKNKGIDKFNYYASDTETILFQMFKSLPFRGESHEYYGLFNSAVIQDFRGTDFIHIRGSRNDEIGYSFEGVDVRSAYTGRNLVRFIPEALEKISLQKSPCASTGNAVAYIQHQLRRPSGEMKFTLKTESDQFTSIYNDRFNTYSYGYANYLFMGESKIFIDNLRFFAAIESNNFDDHYRKFWEGFKIGGTEMPLNDVVGKDELHVLPGNIPTAASNRYTFNGIFSGNFKPFSLKIIGAFNREKMRKNDTPIRHMFNSEHIPEHKQQASLLSFQGEYSTTNNLKIHLQYDILRSNNKTYDPVFKDNLALYKDDLSPMYINFFPFSSPGEIITYYSKSEENQNSITGNVQKRFGHHQLVLGSVSQNRSLRLFKTGTRGDHYWNYGIPFGSDNREHQIQIRDWLIDDIFGYDVFGKKINKGDDVNNAPGYPSLISFYFEDRYSDSESYLNFGIRYDKFSSGTRILKQPRNSESYYMNIPDSIMKMVPHRSYILPRINGTFPVNDDIAVYFSYGKYVQMPKLQDVYANRGYLINQFYGGWFSTDLRAFDAEPVRTVQTLIGMSYQTQWKGRFSISIFNKSIEGSLESLRFLTLPDSMSYLKLDNLGLTLSRGVEFDFQYDNKGKVVWINYTFSDVRGKSSYPISNVWITYKSHYRSDFYPDLPLSPLEYNSKHRLNALFNYKADENFPPLLKNTGISLLFRMKSGHPFTVFKGAFG